METLEAMSIRYSANHFDSDRKVDDALLEKLFDAARQAPSAYNLQHARFMTVEETEARQRLRHVAYNQAKVEHAPVVVMVLGDTLAHEDFPEVAESDVAAGIFDRDLADFFIEATSQAGANPAQARDEAIRSASFAGMNFMNAATDLGLATCPMSGFDPTQFKEAFNIADRYVPVLMITVGYPAETGNWPKKTRRPLEQLVARDVRPGQHHHFSG